MASKGSVIQGLLEHVAMGVLRRLSFTAAQKLRVATESDSAVGTVTTVTSITNLGTGAYAGVTVAAYWQFLSQQTSPFRRNLIVS